MTLSKHLVVRLWRELGQLVESVSFISRSTADWFLYVQQRSDERHQIFVEIGQKRPFLLIERREIIGIIFKERRLPVTAFKRYPMPVSPIPMFADANISQRCLPLFLNNWDCKGKRSRRTIYPTSVAKRLFREMITHFEANFICMKERTIMGYWRKIAAGKKHFRELLDVINQRK